jgi:glycosyltransferase involved in cell wall biosynthesis
VAKLGVGLVYANTLQTWYAIDVAKMLKLPSLWNPRESEPWQTYFDYLPRELANRAYLCLAYPYRVIFVADATRTAWRELESRHNFTVIHNGLNISLLEEKNRGWTKEKARAALSVADEDIVVLLLGTVCPRKGQHDLAHAVRHVEPDLLRKMKLFVVGDRTGPHTSAYSQELHEIVEATDFPAKERFVIVPETPETQMFYKAADIFVCTSRIESYPRVTLEAMWYGLPLVTTPVFGISEQVRSGINAMFYQPGDVRTLAQCLTELGSNREKRQQMADNSPLVLQALSDYETMINSYAELFREAYLSNAE